MLLGIFVVAASATDCYDYNGNVYAGQWPCNPDQTVSSCCSYPDYCLNNGLCLDAGGNNFYSQQGCTDPAYGDSCNRRCSIDNSDGSQHGSYYLLWLCAGDVGAYCCGPDSSCCFNSTVEQTTLGKYTIVTRPPGVSSAAVSATTTTLASTATNMMTTTLLNTATKTASAAAKTITATAKTSNNFGAGIGTGLGVAVFTTTVAGGLGYWFGKRKARDRTNSATESDNAGGPSNNNNYSTAMAIPIVNPQYGHPPYQYAQIPQAQELPGHHST